MPNLALLKHMPGIEKEHISKALTDHFSKDGTVSPSISLEPLGSGYHASGFRAETPNGVTLFIREIGHVGFGHDLPQDRAHSMMEGAVDIPHGMETYMILGVKKDGSVVDLKGIEEVVSVGQFMPEGVENFLGIIQTPANTPEEQQALTDILLPKTLRFAETAADIHRIKPNVTVEEGRSLYQRAMREMIGSGELTMGVLDLIDFETTPWISKKDAGQFVGDMLTVKFLLGDHPERLTRIAGDFWANNIFFHGDNVIVTDGRLIWGDPAIDARGFIGEYLQQDYIRFGHFGGPFTDLAQQTMEHYIEITGDKDIWRYMAIPYAFQTLAEAYFTDNLDDHQRRDMFVHSWAFLKRVIINPETEVLNLYKMNEYLEEGRRF